MSHHRPGLAALLRSRYVSTLLVGTGLAGAALVGHHLLTDRGEDPGGSESRPATRWSDTADLALSSASFGVSGDLARELSPGRSVPVDVRLTNPNDAAVLVTGLRVALRLVDAPGADSRRPCTLADFTVSQADDGLELTLGPGESRSLSALAVPGSSWPRVTMVDAPTNQDGCKGASLTLEYAATGRSRP